MENDFYMIKLLLKLVEDSSLSKGTPVHPFVFHFQTRQTIRTFVEIIPNIKTTLINQVWCI